MAENEGFRILKDAYPKAHACFIVSDWVELVSYYSPE